MALPLRSSCHRQPRAIVNYFAIFVAIAAGLSLAWAIYRAPDWPEQ